jgi:hypothetical protein
MEPFDAARRSGRVAAVHGLVVDIAFPDGMLPALNDAAAISFLPPFRPTCYFRSRSS